MGLQGAIVEKRVTELTLEEFLSYGPQNDPGEVRVSISLSHMFRVFGE